VDLLLRDLLDRPEAVHGRERCGGENIGRDLEDVEDRERRPLIRRERDRELGGSLGIGA
jgi:hypothetical protein